ncbi:hypothetical protein G195_011529 [Phytophthora kernoviae 00238/432]|uniref:ABC transmembrane type-1 domain-containing protein n=1 Tax=Phytophthora kernoviae 00238/432 TaxID=1284355 RepID=A0A8J4RZV7_9STRA|nr:hypothetical protein G195_011529 [Phytophthora kernoviae 00238/432]
MPTLDTSELTPSGDTPYQRIETSRNEGPSKDFVVQDGTTTNSGSASSKKLDLRKEIVHGSPSSFKFTNLYRYATPSDKLLLAVGIVATGANGTLFPLMAILFGDALTGFSSAPVDMDTVNKAALNFTIIAVVLFITDYVAYIAFFHSAERQMKALRREALKHMLYLDISWYDKNDALQLSSRLTGDTVKIKDGMGRKLGDSFRYTLQVIVGFIIGFARGWDVTLVMASVVPFITVSMGWFFNTLNAQSEWAQKVYAEAGSVAEETLGSIRTVASLNGEKKAIAKFEDKIYTAEKENISLHKMSSIGQELLG